MTHIFLKHPPKYPSTFHWPWSPEVHKDDRTIENPENFVGVEVVITEKLDGGNTCLWKGEAFARSTGQPATQGWFAMVKKHHAWKTINAPKNMFFYGEDLYGIHSIEYDPLKEDETYRVFNIREGDDWLSFDEMIAMSNSFSFLTVPVLYRGVFKSVKDITAWFDHHIKQPSVLGPTREGFVVRSTHRFNHGDFGINVAKYVRKGHVQTDEHWTRNWRSATLIK